MPQSLAEKRRKYARHYKGGHALRGQGVQVPADVRRFEGVPEPCFRCGVRDDVPCRHRPWMLHSQGES